MRLFPAFFFTDKAHITVFGGGEEARRKVRLLAKTTAQITLITDSPIRPEFAEEFAGRITIAPRNMAEQALERSCLTLIACRTEANSDQSILSAREYGVPMNVVDRPDACDFTVPSLLERGEIVAAVGSGGAAPVLAKQVRTQLETLLPQSLGPLSEAARDFRPRVYEVLQTGPQRRHFWEAAFSGEPARQAQNGTYAAITPALETLLQEHARAEKQSKTGQVAIVGAGPGDPELLTLKAYRLIQNADIVFHDRLVGPDILDLIRRDATRVSVGKARANHSMPQSEIHHRMIAAARNGLHVVRLKGGDPFIFGRGGEEVEALQAAGIAPTIVPGISAALGCAASAGLPLTHRDHAQSLVFVTGHKKSGGLPDLDWPMLARPAQTVVVFMGVGTAAHIADNLIAAGRAGTTPVAIIQNGTRPDQKISYGRLADLEAMITRHDVSAPALLVIGEVSAIPARTLHRCLEETIA